MPGANSDRPLIAGELAFDAGGHPYSPLHGDVYKSRFGARAEARHVFVAGNDLPDRWNRKGGQAGGTTHTILEIGFGLGVNFLETLSVWRGCEHPDRARLGYVGIEGFPLSASAMQAGLLALGFEQHEIARLIDAWPQATPGMHRIRFGRDVDLTLVFGMVQDCLPQIGARVDTVYLDGFAPARDPVPWSPATMRALARVAAPGCRVATYSAARSVRDALTAHGFVTQLAPGYQGKRHMLQARFEPSSPAQRHLMRAADPLAVQRATGIVIVVGAGLAGQAVVHELALRGWGVRWFDSRDAMCAHKDQPALASHVHFSADDNPLARLTRNASGMLRNGLSPHGLLRANGRLQVATDDPDATAIRHMIDRLAFPESVIRWLDAVQASDATGLRLHRGGLWIDDAVSVETVTAGCNPCETPGNDGSLQVERAHVARLAWCNPGWQAFDAEDNLLGEADAVVLCTATPPATMHLGTSLDTTAMRGQSTRLRSASTSSLRCVVSAGNYLCPMSDGSAVAGSTYDARDDLEPDANDERTNVARWRELSGDSAASIQVLSNHVGLRHTTRDHLPLIGPMVDEAALYADPGAWLRNDRLAIPLLPALWFAGAFGSRGLLWSALAAQIIADQIDGSALPVEEDLLAQSAPGRQTRRLIRKQPEAFATLAVRNLSLARSATRPR